MNVTSIIPYFVLSGAFLLVVEFLLKRVKFYQKAVENAAKAKYKALDGLRGFLALSVFFHHAMIAHNYFQTGTWGTTPSQFYTFLGEGAVAFFFMITGFLFWSKAIAQGTFKLREFYTARLLRIYPMYWFSLALIVLIILAMTGFSLSVSPVDLALQVGRWMTCGLFDFPFIRGIQDESVFPWINGFDASLVNAGITWTLVYELQFYLVLPLLAGFVKPGRFLALFAAVLLWQKFLPAQQSPMVMMFVFGMAAAHLINRFSLSQSVSSWKGSIAILLLLGATPVLVPGHYLANIESIGAIFFAFLLIAYGNSLFNLLTLPASRCLGIISYSVYLLHGIVLFVVLNSVNAIYPIEALHPLSFWGLVGLCGLLVIGISAMTYRWIEYPFLRFKFSKLLLRETQPSNSSLQK